MLMFAMCTVPKPEMISHIQAAGALSSSLAAYTALHYLLHLRPKEFILIIPSQRVRAAAHTLAAVMCTDALQALKMMQLS